MPETRRRMDADDVEAAGHSERDFGFNEQWIDFENRDGIAWALF
jgi:hypothetical protein